MQDHVSIIAGSNGLREKQIEAVVETVLDAIVCVVDPMERGRRFGSELILLQW